MEDNAGNTSTASIITDEYDIELGYHPSVIPMDIRLGLTNVTANERGTAEGPSCCLKWGILSCGKVAHDFVQALKRLTTARHDIVAAATRNDIDRAKEFATLHSISTFYGSYQELCNNSSIDIIYVASIHPYHKEHAEMALRAGKHVLVEKPMAMTAKDAQYIYDLGKELNLFVGEGMWTRFFPAVEWTRQELETSSDISTNNCIGPCRMVKADFCIDGDDVGPYPSDSIYDIKLGGGCACILGPYVIGAAMLPFSERFPDRIAATGIIPNDNDDDNNGDTRAGELALGVTLTFGDKGSHGKTSAIASLLVGYFAETSELTEYSCKGGRILIDNPAHCPTSVTKRLKNVGNSMDSRGKASMEVTLNFPFPPTTTDIDKSGGIRMPNSMGFIYEAEAVRRLIKHSNQKTFPQWTPRDSVACLQIVDYIKEQLSAQQQEPMSKSLRN